MIEKSLESWNDYKNNLKYKKSNFTIKKIITHILIEDTNRNESFKAKQVALKANLVQGQYNNNRRYGNKSQGYKPNNLNFIKRKALILFVKNQFIMPLNVGTEQETTKNLEILPKLI